MTNLAELFKYLLFLKKKYLYLFLLLIFLSVIVALSEIFLIGLVAEFLMQDESLGIYSKQIEFVFNYLEDGVVIILIALLVFLGRYLLIKNTAQISFGLGATLTSNIFNKLIYQNTTFFSKDDKSNHIAFLVSKVEIVIQTLVLPLLTFFSGLIISSIYLVFLSYVSFNLSLLVLIVASFAY